MTKSRWIAGLLPLCVLSVAAGENTTKTKALDLNPKLNIYAVPSDDGKTPDPLVETKESIVEIRGQKYRQIEYDGHRYYIRALQEGVETNQFECQRVDTIEAPALIDTEVKVTRRTHLFVEALAHECNEEKHVMRLSPDALNIGVSVGGDKPGSAPKKVFINPIKKTGGFSTTF